MQAEFRTGPERMDKGTYVCLRCVIVARTTLSHVALNAGGDLRILSPPLGGWGSLRADSTQQTKVKITKFYSLP
jgi:hypothetical protein